MMNAKGRPQWRSSFWGVLLFALVSLFATGCGGGDDDGIVTPSPSGQPINNGFSITAPGVADNKVQVEVGQTLQFSPDNATYTSSNPTAATITPSGLLKGVTAGQSTVIKATYSAGVEAQNSVTVSVVEPRIPDRVGVWASPGEAEERLGGRVHLFAFYNKATGGVEVRDVSDRAGSWASSNPVALSVSSNTGVYEVLPGGSAYGKADITVTLSDPILSKSPSIANKIDVGLLPVRGKALTAITLSKSGFAGNPITFELGSPSSTGGFVGTPITSNPGPPSKATLSLPQIEKQGPIIPNVFKAEGTFIDNTVIDISDEVVWKSSDPEVIRFLGSKSVVFSGKTGKATITAERLRQSGSSTIPSTTAIEITVTP